MEELSITQLFDDINMEADVYRRDRADYHMKKDIMLEEIRAAADKYVASKMMSYADMLARLIDAIGFSWRTPEEAKCDGYDGVFVHISSTLKPAVHPNNMLWVVLPHLGTLYPDMSKQCQLSLEDYDKLLPEYYKLIVLEQCKPILDALDIAVSKVLKQYTCKLKNEHAMLVGKLEELVEVLAKHKDDTKVAEDGAVELWLDGKHYVGSVKEV